MLIIVGMKNYTAAASPGEEEAMSEYEAISICIAGLTLLATVVLGILGLLKKK